MMIFFKRFLLLLLSIGLSYCSFNSSDDFSLNLDDISPLTDASFVELFHAFEIEEIENVKLDPIKMQALNPVQYSDYIIQKYSLWHPIALNSVLRSYQEKKESLYIDKEKWGKALLNAQNFKPVSQWKDELNSLESDNKDYLLNFTKSKNPEISKLIESLEKGNFQDSEKLNEKLKISDEKFKDWAVDNEEEINVRLNNLMRTLTRHYFKESLEQSQSLNN